MKKLIEFTESFVAQLLPPKVMESKESHAREQRLVLRTKIEAIHSVITANDVFYPQDRLQGSPQFQVNGQVMPTGVHSWLHPFPKPVLINHDGYDVNSAIGRVEQAWFSEQTEAGVPGIILVARISDPDAVEKVLDGRYYTVSVGVTSDAAFCSVCGANQLEGWCDHDRGQEYDGKKAYWITGNLWFKEVSFVNAPADRFAKIIDINDPAPASSAATAESEGNPIRWTDARPRIIHLIAGEPSENTTKGDSPVAKTRSNKDKHSVTAGSLVISSSDGEPAAVIIQDGSVDFKGKVVVMNQADGDASGKDSDAPTKDSQVPQAGTEAEAALAELQMRYDELTAQCSDLEADLKEARERIAELESQATSSGAQAEEEEGRRVTALFPIGTRVKVAGLEAEEGEVREFKLAAAYGVRMGDQTRWFFESDLTQATEGGASADGHARGSESLDASSTSDGAVEHPESQDSSAQRYESDDHPVPDATQPSPEEGASRDEGSIDELKESLARRVVEMRILLERTSPEDGDSTLERYKTKSVEYLSDALSDLVQELGSRLSASAAGGHPVPKINPVGLAAFASERNIEVVADTDSQSDRQANATPIDVNELVRRLTTRRR